MRTPHIQKLKTSGGTLYTFTSANEDLTNLIIDSSKVFKFSKFACLNLPDIVSGKKPEDSESSEAVSQGLYIDTYSAATSQSINLHTKFKRNIQNYILNFETFLINENENINIENSPAEAVLFNWLQNVGCMNFTSVTESDDYAVSLNSRFSKESSPNRVVEYIGNIDIINRSEVEGYSYTQLYITIPTEAGKTPKILFNEFEGGNWEVKNNPEITAPGNIIGTLETNEDYLAYYDSEDTVEADGIYSADKIYGIDFNSEDYKDIVELSGIRDFEHYNMSSDSGDFEFNAVLIYYDIFDRKTGLTETKLYGILFLDNITEVSIPEITEDNIVIGYIQRYPKYKNSQDIDGKNGNSYSIKVELNVNTASGETNNTMLPSDQTVQQGISIFSDAMQEMKKNSDMIFDINKKYMAIVDDINRMSTIITALVDENERLNRIITEAASTLKYNLPGFNINIEEANNVDRISVSRPDILLYKTYAIEGNTDDEDAAIKLPELSSWHSKVYTKIMNMNTGENPIDNPYIIYNLDNCLLKDGETIAIYFTGYDNGMIVQGFTAVIKYNDIEKSIAVANNFIEISVISLENGIIIVR